MSQKTGFKFVAADPTGPSWRSQPPAQPWNRDTEKELVRRLPFDRFVKKKGGPITTETSGSQKFLPKGSQ